MNSILAWSESLGLPDGVPAWAVSILALICVFVVVIVPSGAVMGFLDRKLGADVEARIGPSRAGPAGILQPLANLLKHLQKSDPTARNWKEIAWLTFQTGVLYSTVAALPLGSASLLLDTDMSVFIPFWAALSLALGTMLLGFSQESVPGWFGGVRMAAQALAGAFPALLSILCAGIRAGGFRWGALAGAQSPFVWAAITSPFQFLAFLSFVGAGMVLLSIPPFDSGITRPDIHGGVSAPLYGWKFSLFRLSRFYSFFLWSIIASVVFLGGWGLPEGFAQSLAGDGSFRLLQFLQLLILLTKTFLLMLVVIWISKANPRVRVDHATEFAWRVLSPAALVALVGTVFWVALFSTVGSAP